MPRSRCDSAQRLHRLQTRIIRTRTVSRVLRYRRGVAVVQVEGRRESSRREVCFELPSNGASHLSRHGPLCTAAVAIHRLNA